MKLSDFSIKRPVFTIVTMLLFIILGIVSVIGTPLKLIPNINPPAGAVVVTYPGAGPKEVVEEVTKPLEESLATLSGLKNMTSTSQEGSSLILLEFTNKTNIEEVQDDIENAMNEANLPDEAVNLRFLKFDPSQIPIVQLAISTTDGNKTFEQKAKKLQQQLSQVDGVASADYQGLQVDEVKVQLKQSKLKEYGITQKDVVDLLQANNVSVPGSTIITGGKQLTTRIIRQLSSVEEIKNLVVSKKSDGSNLLLNELGTIKIAPSSQETITRNNQQPALLMSVFQQSDSNTATVSKQFNRKLNNLLEKEEYTQLDAAILFDQGEYVQKAIKSMGSALVLGGTFAMIVLFFFLRNFKTPFIIGVSIPFSVIVTFVLIYFAGFTLNIMTLGGLALGIGMLVDNSIVVIENIYRHLNMGKHAKKAASEGTKEVGVPIIASTLTTVAVFLPVVFITGIIGDLFKEFSFTIAFSLLASLFVALTVVPMMASRILKPTPENVEEKRLNSRVLRSLEKSIKWALAHRISVLLLTGLFLALGILGITQTGTEFLPQSDQGFFSINVEMENGSALTETDQTVKSIENVLSDEKIVKDYFSLVGSTQDQGPASPTNASMAQIFVSLIDANEREQTTSEFVAAVKDDIERAVTNAKQISFNQQSTAGTKPNTLTFNVRDNNEKRLTNAVQTINKTLTDFKDVTELTNNLAETKDELQVKIDTEAARSNGLAPGQIAEAVSSAMRGTKATKITTENNDVIDVDVSYGPEVKESKQSLANLLLKTPAGSYIPLDDVAIIETGDSPVTINRRNQEHAVEFTVKFSNETTLGEFKQAVQTEIESLDLSEEVEVNYTGDFELLGDTIKQLGMAFVLAVVFVYLVMAAQFESFKYPFVILFTVPLVFIGVSLGLTATQTPISATALIGLVVLAGIVVNNAIVLVDYINQLKEHGYRSYDAIVESVKVRTRPILMTAITTMLGLLPIALGLGEGTEIQQPMGITVIGGLVSSTFLTLFVIPVLYSYVDRDTRKHRAPSRSLKIPARLLQEQKENSNNEEVIKLLESLLETVKKSNK
ncbi:efflux RND transporter permease subunit [Bacillus tianshenii]|nr:efflux RND transporter permease subunit [Bacillus tianshenii]